MTSAEKFSLKWNDFQENICSAFSDLRDDTNFTDVTLLTEDGQNLDAHKLILSSTSPFFMNILKVNKHPNPIIYLKGFKATALVSILDFMYYGVADIHQDKLDDFLALAEELQLKGLTKGTEEMPELEEPEKIKKKLIPKKNSLNPADTYKSFTTNKMEAYCDGESDIKQLSTVVELNNSVAQVHFSGGSAEDLKSTLWSMISENGTVLTCTVCGKSKDKTIDRKAKEHMMNHVESLHIEGVLYECNQCDKTFRSKAALHMHTFKNHK